MYAQYAYFTCLNLHHVSSRLMVTFQQSFIHSIEGAGLVYVWYACATVEKTRTKEGIGNTKILD